MGRKQSNLNGYTLRGEAARYLSKAEPELTAFAHEQVTDGAE